MGPMEWIDLADFRDRDGRHFWKR